LKYKSCHCDARVKRIIFGKRWYFGNLIINAIIMTT